MSLPEWPALSTTRLTVRAVADTDLPALMAVNGDDETTRFLPYASWRSLDDAQAWLARMRSLEAAGGTRQLVMARRADGLAIGTVLLFKHDPASARLELGYVLARSHWRQGLAREALAAVIRQVFGPMGQRRIEAEVNPDNTASNALLQALGFTLEGRLRQRYTGKGRSYDIHLWGLLASDPRPGADA
ncbi:GNAT family N-acetyltransferase [Ideonella sp. 4Y16]|uniref:GNAT family N-acetyltransferase n=1 Tax=Ideonella alba TaxID=2824118 RepID=A0A940YAA0_9BURK|nr:GNAT family N-acetyltransferase [Ideonella alba]MBQ0931491.1 GNAT family N-acetyltransferase [Ideonella alba]MBQ0943796.1 GNAT family N-acetyltransferase [Ideonella alba]